MLSKPEIDLFRLLKSTEALVEEALSRRETANISLRTFQKYVEALVFRHSQLEKVRDTPTTHSSASSAVTAASPLMPDSSTSAPSLEAIADFKRRIEFLKRVVYSDEFKNALSPIVTTQPEPQPHSVPLSNGSSASFIKTALNSEARRQLGLEEEGSKPSIDEQRASPRTTPTKLSVLSVPEQESSSSSTAIPLQNERPSSISSTGPRTPKKLGGNVGGKALLDHHKQVQEDYTDEMLEFTQKMKENAIATSKIVSHQLGTLDKLDTKLEQNSDAASLANQALSELFESSSGSTWFHWSIMMIATLMFAGMYLFMKLFPKIPTE